MNNNNVYKDVVLSFSQMCHIIWVWQEIVRPKLTKINMIYKAKYSSMKNKKRYLKEYDNFVEYLLFEEEKLPSTLKEVVGIFLSVANTLFLPFEYKPKIIERGTEIKYINAKNLFQDPLPMDITEALLTIEQLCILDENGEMIYSTCEVELSDFEIKFIFKRKPDVESCNS